MDRRGFTQARFNVLGQKATSDPGSQVWSEKCLYCGGFPTLALCALIHGIRLSTLLYDATCPLVSHFTPSLTHVFFQLIDAFTEKLTTVAFRKQVFCKKCSKLMSTQKFIEIYVPHINSGPVIGLGESFTSQIWAIRVRLATLSRYSVDPVRKCWALRRPTCYQPAFFV